jgi:hypothetical protein
VSRGLLDDEKHWGVVCQAKSKGELVRWCIVASVYEKKCMLQLLMKNTVFVF